MPPPLEGGELPGEEGAGWLVPDVASGCIMNSVSNTDTSILERLRENRGFSRPSRAAFYTSAPKASTACTFPET